MLTGAFYPEISGAGLQAKSLVSCLNSKFDFYVLTTCKDFNLPTRGITQHIAIYRIMIRPDSIVSKISSFFQFLRIFLKIRKKVDILHLHGFSQKTLLFILLGKMFNKKIIQKMTSAGDDDPASIGKRKFGKFMLFFFSKADVFISVSPRLSQEFKHSRLSDRRLLTIPNGVDPERFRPLKNPESKIILRRKLGLPEIKKILVFVGFFSQDKGVDLLMDAWKKIRSQEKDNASILFIGSTDTSYFEIKTNLIKEVNDDIVRYGMKDEIFFVEKTLEIEKYYQAADIFVLPSRREGLPNSLLEAMSSGLACIASRLPGITDYVIKEDKSGVLFEIDDVEDLSKKMLILLQNDFLVSELGKAARDVIIKKFDIKDIARRYEKVYKDLSGNDYA